MASLFPRLHCIIALPIAIVLPIDSTAFHTGISPIKGAENMKMRSDMSARNCLLFFFLIFFFSISLVIISTQYFEVGANYVFLQSAVLMKAILRIFIVSGYFLSFAVGVLSIIIFHCASLPFRYNKTDAHIKVPLLTVHNH